MNKKDFVEGLLFAGFRILGTSCALFGLISLVFQLLDSWSAFDPSYLGPFVASTIMRPLILIGAGLLLHFLAGKMAHRMAKRFNRS